MARVVSIRKALSPKALPGAEILPGKRLPGETTTRKTTTKPKIKSGPFRDRHRYGVPLVHVKKSEMDIIEPFHRFTTKQFHGKGEDDKKYVKLSIQQVKLLQEIRLANGEVWTPPNPKDPRWHEMSQSRCQTWEIRRNKKIIKGLEREAEHANSGNNGKAVGDSGSEDVEDDDEDDDEYEEEDENDEDDDDDED